MLAVTLEGEAALDTRLADLPSAVLAIVAARCAALADELLARVEQRLHGGVLQSRSGALAASISVEGPAIAGDAVTTTVVSNGDLKYAAIQEFGGVTRPHDIRPSRAKALAFVAGGEQVFARIVHHPGARLPERSYLRASLAEMAPRIDSEVKAAVVEAIAKTARR